SAPTARPTRTHCCPRARVSEWSARRPTRGCVRRPRSNCSAPATTATTWTTPRSRSWCAAERRRAEEDRHGDDRAVRARENEARRESPRLRAFRAGGGLRFLRAGEDDRVLCTHRITEVGEKIAPIGWDYIERIEVTDRAAYEKELAEKGKAFLDELYGKYLD